MLLLLLLRQYFVASALGVLLRLCTAAAAEAGACCGCHYTTVCVSCDHTNSCDNSITRD